MANARTQREMHCLGIDPETHTGAPQGKQLWGRVVLPVPTCVSSAPVEHPQKMSSHKREYVDISHKAHMNLPDSNPTMESSDAESIERWLQYATLQMLRQCYRFDDDDYQSTTSVDRISLRDVNRGRTDTPSDTPHVNPIRQSLST